MQEILALKLREENNAQKAAHKASGYWNPSELGFCDRSSVLKHAGVEPNDFDDASLRNFWLGNIIHGELQSRIGDVGERIELYGHERPYKSERLRISGRLDTYLVNDGVRESVEFKSTNPDKLKFGGLPEPRHIFQLACSLMIQAVCACQENAQTSWTCGLCGGNGLLPLPERGRVVYVSKKDATFEEYTVNLTDKLAAQVEAEFLRLEKLYQQYLQTGVLPPALPPVEKKGVIQPDWRTNYCRFVGKGCCLDEYRAGQEIHSGGPGVGSSGVPVPNV